MLAILVVLDWAVGTVAKKELIIGHHVDPTTLNAVTTKTAEYQSVCELITEELTVLSARDDDILPWLATSWEWADDQELLSPGP